MKLNKQELRRKVAASVTGIGWANGQQACVYADIGVDTLKRWLADGLPHSRIGGLLRIKYSDIDQFIMQYRSDGGAVEFDPQDMARTVRQMISKVL